MGPTLLAALALAASAGPGDARVVWTLTLEPDPAPGALAVEVVVTGVRGRDLAMELGTFGEWTEVDGYLRDLEADPPLRARAPDDPRLRFDLPSRWDGTARLAYRIALLDAESDAGRRHGLLPRRSGRLVSAIAVNTLPNVFARDAELEAERTVVLRAPDDHWIATGWADPALGELEVAIETSDQGPIYFHPTPRVAAEGEGAERVHVVQLNTVTDTTGAVLAVTRGALSAIADATGVPRGSPQRVFVTGEREHVSGGMRSDHGVCLSWNPKTDDVTWRHMVVHELFHEWLPGKLPPDGPSLVWLFEGFTQYLSLWIAARGGLVDADGFAGRLAELDRDARASSAFGRVAFGDEDVAWRDGDGPLETLAYNGGALLAFHLDVALRERGTTLAAVLGEWIRAGDGYSLDRLRSACRKHRIRGFWDDFVREPADLPPVEEVLERLGFRDREAERAAHVTYLGVRVEDGVVVAIDPDGPQAARDLRVGDEVLAIGPVRDAPLAIADGHVWEHDFGLTQLVPWWPDGGWWADVRRDGEERRVAIEPWLQPGGIERVRVADPARARAFFDLE